MTRLPNGVAAIVPLRKVVDYLLNPDHPQGRSKHRFFLNLGFDPDTPEQLSSALRDHVLANEVVIETASIYGRKYVVQCSMRTPDGRDPCIRTVWIVEDAAPRFVTAYPSAP